MDGTEEHDVGESQQSLQVRCAEYGSSLGEMDKNHRKPGKTELGNNEGAPFSPGFVFPN